MPKLFLIWRGCCNARWDDDVFRMVTAVEETFPGHFLSTDIEPIVAAASNICCGLQGKTLWQ